MIPPIPRRAALAAALLPVAARAQPAYPARAVKLVVPYPAGSGPDIFGRVVARALQDGLGGSFVVENRAGALGMIGTTEVARSRPDGYTLLITTNTTQAANVALVRNLAYDPVRDFVPVNRVATAPMMLLARPDFPATDLAGLAAHARSRPEGLSGGYGSAASRVSMAKLGRALGVNLVPVPYPGIPPAVNDLVGGHIALTFADLPVAVPMVRSGQLKGLGVTSPRRIAAEPAIPAIAESFPGFEVLGWVGLVAPAGIPAPALAALSGTLDRALREPEMRARLEAMHYEVAPLGPDAFRAYIGEEIARWTRDAAEAGIEPQ